MVAGFTPDQLSAMQGVSGIQGQAGNTIQAGQDLVTQGSNPFTQSNIQNFMNPYTQQVTNATMANINETNAQQQQQVIGNAILRGAWGGDRAGIAQSELARQQGLASNPTLAGLNQANYSQALNTAGQQGQFQQQGGTLLGQLGALQQGTGLQGLQALMGSGGLQQQLQQAQLNVPYQQYLEQRAWPYQNAQFLGSIASGIGPALGGKTEGSSTTNYPSPSMLSQIAGAGLTGAGIVGGTGGFGSGGWLSSMGKGASGAAGAIPSAMMLSDRRMKEDVSRVGSTDDGQPIYKFKYLGDNTTHMGLMADQVEKSHPEAVSSLGGIKMVDYDQATKDSERNLGGRINPVPQRYGFSVGGTPRSYYANGGATEEIDASDMPPIRYTPSTDSDRQADINALSMAQNDTGSDIPNNAQLTAFAGAGQPNLGVPLPRQRPDMAQASLGDQNPFPQDDGDSQELSAQSRQEMPGGIQPAQSDDWGQKFAKSPWLALTAAGLGIMGGKSPYPLVNIGEGGQQGVKTLEQQREQVRKDVTIQQAAERLAREAAAQKETGRHNLATEKLEESKIDRDRYFQPIMSPFGDYAVAMPKNPSIDKPQYYKINPETGTPDLGSPTETPPKTQAKEDAPIARTSVAPQNGRVITDDPVTMLNPGKVTPAERNKDIAALYFDPKSRPAGRAQANAETKLVAKEAETAASLDTRAKAMRRNLDVISGFVNDPRTNGKLAALLTPGTTGDERQKLINTYSTLANANKNLPQIPQDVVAAVNALGKDSVLGGFRNITNEGLSAREAQPIIRAAMGAMPSFTLPEQSSRALLASMEAAAQRQRDRQAYLTDYKAKNGGYSDGWQSSFDKSHPPESYVARAVFSILPEERKRELPQAVKEIRGFRDNLIKAESSGDQGAADSARLVYQKAKTAFDRRYGGLGNYLTFGAM